MIYMACFTDKVKKLQIVCVFFFLRKKKKSHYVNVFAQFFYSALTGTELYWLLVKSALTSLHLNRKGNAHRASPVMFVSAQNWVMNYLCALLFRPVYKSIWNSVATSAALLPINVLFKKCPNYNLSKIHENCRINLF